MNSEHDTTQWRTLYRAGAIAPLITLSFYLTQILVIVFGREPFPETVEAWFNLFQHSKLLGLIYLNALDIFSIALLGLMFLALYTALKKDDAALMTIATWFACLGIPVFIVPRVAMLSVVKLSEQYAAATTETQRTILLAAGETLNALGVATPQTVGFFFVAVASVIISVVILRGDVFKQVTAYVGFGAGFMTAANHIAMLAGSPVAAMLMPINGLLWLIWWLLISRGLFQLVKET